ncbi:hypothetical protein [Bradyrhizobium sp. AUGA SZCCT0158]|uniref:hypothetical protein n=1 Tax=Bradyrhizobium sp. AUGA SZCCT0158 TaxID=2807661 RepID=UPI001BA6B67B|nr:hypothetical protein [Bradyrhizobium sp. AUGA SZCCT0158]
MLLQAAYSDYQVGAAENFHQAVEDSFIVLRPGPKVFFQYALRFANRLNSQLLIGHVFLPIKQNAPHKSGAKNQDAFGKYPRYFALFDQFLFQCGTSARDRASLDRRMIT